MLCSLSHACAMSAALQQVGLLLTDVGPNCPCACRHRGCLPVRQAQRDACRGGAEHLSSSELVCVASEGVWRSSECWRNLEAGIWLWLGVSRAAAGYVVTQVAWMSAAELCTQLQSCGVALGMQC